MVKISSEVVLRQVRLALLTIGGMIAARGYMDAGTIEMISGGLMIVLTWVWSNFANRLMAKINAIAGHDIIVIAPNAIASATTNPSVIPSETTKVVAAPTVANAAPAIVQSSRDVKVVTT